MKTRRQGMILDLVDRHSVASQEDLRRRLEGLGISVTQATLSRDIAELGLVKASGDGAYHRPGPDAANPAMALLRLQHAVAEYLAGVDRAQQLVVLKTGRAQAQPLAEALDRAAMPEIVGTIAGEDTVLVVCRTAGTAATIARRIEAITRK
jgi:transcriptional regulator of arginine metabolism